jgi:methylase of polypeptide subunit release factors
VAASKPTIHELDFCGQVASTVNALVSENPGIFPFREARVEGFGTGAGRRKRKDLRFFGRGDKLVLCGEVKLPGKLEGRSPYDAKLCADAQAKADEAGIRYFFTWNVNTFVLWDRSLWDRPLLDRRVWQWRLARTLASSEDVAREENLNFIKTHFLPDLLRDLAEIISGRRREGLPPDDIFIRSLESHLDWPVQLLSAYILEHADSSKPFDLRVQRWMTDQDWTFVRKPHEEWAKAVDNMSKTLAYVWANRLIFYKALRARFADLPRLELRASVKKPADALSALNGFFKRAVEQSGDYEPLLMPEASDWATELVFHPVNALDAWRGLLRGIESVDFREVPSDVVGRIFQKLIGPDERHRYGQHFTGDNVVDLINGFCIRNAGDTILDPACGSGSFLVRAYYRKRHLDEKRPHLDLIGELFGCDIALYPAHLATLNLAAREINDEANYPRIARRNFFDFEPQQPFCEIPNTAGGQRPIALPPLDAVVGNPPYVRQEKIVKKEKPRFAQIAASAWPGLRLSGRSDLHCYFWPAAARLLKPGGYFGFLTSSSWLDVEYGFALQGWILRHFCILAVMESAAEPWFEDARVKTCVTILQRCDDEAARMANRVRFVRLARPLADIIGVAPGQDEDARQAAIDGLRERILGAESDVQDRDLRIIVKRQGDLWTDGVRAGAILGGVGETRLTDEDEEETPDEEPSSPEDVMNHINDVAAGGYRAGKWGRYVRAPDLYFEIMRRFGQRFVALGEIATIRRGITSGCDAFFMPKDITADMLAKHQSDRAFRQNAGGAPRKDVESGKLRIVQAGDGSVHPIEAKYLAPELHSPMEVDRPIVRAADLHRVVLLVGEPMEKLKTKSPWVWRYLRYGMTETFASTKSKAVPVPKRSTCAARNPWYDLTGLVRPGIAFWPKIQKYRHIVPANEERIICNCNLYDLHSDTLAAVQQKALLGILNSTLVGLFKAFYGRFAGTETTLKTEIVDVILMEVPDPRNAKARTLKRLADCFDAIKNRPIGHFVEAQLLDCHSPERARRLADGPLMFAAELRESDRIALDNAVFELLGVDKVEERKHLVAALHRETALYFREGRVVELQAMENRAKAKNRRFRLHDLAADIWDAAELEDATPLAEWIGQQPESDSLVIIPEEQPAVVTDDVMFSPNTVFFGKKRKSYLDCQSRGQAELVAYLANVGVSGEVKLPADLAPCLKLLDRVERRVQHAVARLKELAESRTGDERVRAQLMEVLERWFVLGRESHEPAPHAEPHEEGDEADTKSGSQRS